MEQELAVLNALEPPTGITELGIDNYQGLHLPCWMTKERHSSNSGFVCFSSLKTLELSGFGALESICAGPFPSLIVLRIFRMPHLLELSTTTRIVLADEDGVTVCGNQESQCCFPRLSFLRIVHCPKLNVRPWFLPSLESLILERSNEQLLFLGSSFRSVHPHGDESESPPSCSSSDGASSSLSLLKKLELTEMTGPSACSGWELLQHLTALESLEIDRCEELRQLPEGIQHLTSLQHLRIEKCGALEQLPEGLGGLLSLRSLWIWKLPSLRCLPESMRGLTSLQRLHIGLCDSLHRLPDQLGELRSLQKLEIRDLRAPLPESMQRLTSLHRLTISDCDALAVLPEWIGQLSALQSLEIRGCSGLTSLPSSIKRLTALQTLLIHDNPYLVRRCKQGEGEDWHLISHIPCVRIH